LNRTERTRWRTQAREWLRADLVLWDEQLTDSKGLNQVQQVLEHWRSDPDLESVRSDKALAQLPELERKEWHQLWADVDKLLQQARR
jgi:hypothetical protein